VPAPAVRAVPVSVVRAVPAPAVHAGTASIGNAGSSSPAPTPGFSYALPVGNLPAAGRSSTGAAPVVGFGSAASATPASSLPERLQASQPIPTTNTCRQRSCAIRTTSHE
jgi:hypothetical protein